MIELKNNNWYCFSQNLSKACIYKIKIIKIYILNFFEILYC